MGVLPNGLHYYIRKNSAPEKRAELRLVVNAGSVLETDDQLGLAHFIEHMAFNGTTHFAKNELVGYLQSIGVRFGADLNASTSFDETVYILPVPTDKARIVEQAFTILEDWAHGQLFDSAEVVAERGVVREEWRGGRGSSERMLEQWFPTVFRNSIYAQRLPIGNESSIMTATPSRLRSFYKDWYRPELMAVIAVGDFDAAAIEAQIKKHFAAIPSASTAPERKIVRVPLDTVPVIAIATDREATRSAISLMFRQPQLATNTVADYRRDLTGTLYLEMLNSRLGEIAQKPDAAFLDARASRSGFLARDVERFSLDARVAAGGAEKGLEAMLLEVRRAREFGFLQSELDRARANLLRTFEHANMERDKTQSAVFAEELIRHFLQGEPIPGIGNEYNLARELLPTITLADVNYIGASWVTGTKPLVLFQGPKIANAPPPTETGILASLDRASKVPLVAYTETVSSDALIRNQPTAGKVMSQRSIPAVGVTEWKLSNGARVLIKPTDFKVDEILFGGYAPGGTALAPDKDFMSAAFAAQIAGLSGLGTFTRVELGRKLSGKSVGLTSGIAETLHELGGRAVPSDLETLLQLVYLEFTATRLDTGAISAFRKNASSTVEGRSASPDEVFRDSVQVTLAQHDFRARPLTSASLAEVDPQKAVEFFRNTFSNAAGFTFVFVGNVDTLSLRPLVEKYLASLPAQAPTDGARATTRGYPRGVVEKTVRMGLEPKATTIIAFTGQCTYSPETRFALRALTSVVQLRLNQSLREKLGKTYSPSVRGNCSREPRQEYFIPIQFGSSPGDAESLTKTVFALIDSLKTQGPTESDVEKVREQIIRTHEVEQRQNQYWLTNILVRSQTGEDLAGLHKSFDAMIAGLTTEKIRQAARRYFDFQNYARFVLLPESL
jgi:zinc protease